MVGDLVPRVGGDGPLSFFDGFIDKLVNTPTFDAEYMIMMYALVQLKY